MRGKIDPTVLTAIMTSGVAYISTMSTLIVTTLLERYKVKKKNGLLIIRYEQNEIQIPFDATDEEVKKKLELMKKIAKIENILITERKDE